ncbi:hypothetical protein [Vibrio coralliilyticus]|uniref:hypothetical protein n=1 Tax=Vibrio coralliilyticus TaxID=190893 RepID=UPI001561A3A7|nr:hypothetical protein [Vibrio coralliilyticus]NRF17523.1 hypothetical protein [Vibrio coralliilyticus]
MSLIDPDILRKYYHLTLAVIRSVGQKLIQSKLLRITFIFTLSMAILLFPYFLYFHYSDEVLSGNVEYNKQSQFLHSEQMFLRTADMLQICINSKKEEQLNSYFCSEAFNSFKNDAQRVKLKESYINELLDNEAYELMLVETKHFVRGLESQKLRTSGLYKRMPEVEFLFYNWFFYLYALISLAAAVICVYGLQRVTSTK